MKKNIEPLESALDRLLALRGVTFEYKDPERALSSPGEHMGMIAQEVEEVFPEWVDEDADGFKYLTPSGLEALTVEAFRELRDEKNSEIETLKQTISTQQALIDDLLQRVEALEDRVTP